MSPSKSADRKKKSATDHAGVSRSASVRQRRDQKPPRSTRTPSSRNRQKASVSKGGRVHTPSVVTRGGGSYSNSLLTKSRTNVRKKFTIPLNSPGAEIHMPSLPVFNPDWRLLSGFIALALSAFMIMLITDQQYRVSTVEFNGLQRVSPYDVEMSLGLNGQPIYTIKPQDVKAAVETDFSELKNISVWIGLPAKVVIDAEERQPDVAWLQNDETFWIDDEGFIFPPTSYFEDDMSAEAGESALQSPETIEFTTPLVTIISEGPPPARPLPILSEDEILRLDQDDSEDETDLSSSDKMDERQSQTDPELIQAALQLSKQIPPGTPLIYDELDGLGWNDPRGWDIYIGSNLENLDLKMIIFETIFNELNNRGITPSMINVKYIHAPFYRVE